MTPTRTHRWSYSTGERGRNRVRAFEHPATGLIYLEFSDRSTRRRVALGHRDRNAARGKAEELATALRNNEAPPTPVLTLQSLFDNYLREVTPEKGESKQKHDHRAAALFLHCMGPLRRVATLNRRDWDSFIAWRRRGGDTRGGKVSGRKVRTRVIEYDLKFLHSVLNWAVMARDASGNFLLERNPLKGMPWPKEISPNRPALTDEQYVKLLGAAPRVGGHCTLALVLAHETGHRIGSIRLLRWSDVDLSTRVIRWRGENDKIGFEHETPLTGEAVAALDVARRERPSVGEAWIFATPGKSDEPPSRHLFRDWWERMEAGAGLAPVSGRGWHSLRRQFATELKHTPLRDLCHLGGWKDPQTVLKCYQKADEITMRAALETRARLRPDGLQAQRRSARSKRIDTMNRHHGPVSGKRNAPPEVATSSGA
jgi:integrase